MTHDPQHRMAEITGAPERLSSLPADKLDKRHLAAIERLQIIYDYAEGQPLHSFYAILAHSPDFFASYMDLGIAITAASALPPRWREMLILRTGWLCGAPYQWGEHVYTTSGVIFQREEIERIIAGSQSPDWADQDRAILQAAEELHTDAMIADATWQELAAFLNERQLLELPIVVGHYHTTAFVQNALRIALNDHNPGLSAR